MTQYSTVFFDLDGTLTDSAPGILNALGYALEKMDEAQPPLSVLQRFIGPPLFVSFTQYLGFSEEKAREAIRLYREYYNVKGLYENAPYPGIEDVLRGLRERGQSAFVATSKPQYLADRVLDHFRMTPLFNAVFGAQSDNESKADVIRRAVAASDERDVSRILMVGDREQDVTGAHTCGLACCGVGYGFALPGEFEACGADFVAKDVAALNELLRSFAPVRHA